MSAFSCVSNLCYMIIHVNENMTNPKTYLVPFELETDMMSLKTLGSMAKITDLNRDYTR